jgi:hypothetical protein
MKNSQDQPPSAKRRALISALAAAAALPGSGLVRAQANKAAALRVPSARRMYLPAIPGASAIWGASGQDASGSIWVGITMDLDRLSARVYQYDTASQIWSARGSVMEEVIKLDPATSVRSQMKIHTKFIVGADGMIYFGSSDEQGESDKTLALPTFGGMLWRIDPKTRKWERLFSTKEGLIAATGGGRFIYALGYWGYTLYRYDTVSRTMQSKRIASEGAHVTRNFIADQRGHVFVPRLRPGSTASPELIEFDDNFNEIAATPLAHYAGREPMGGNHGMIGVTTTRSGRTYFVTHIGRLYEIQPRVGKGSDVVDLGFIHPSGAKYCPGLFELEGGRRLGSFATFDGGFEWITHDLERKKSTTQNVDLFGAKNVLLYGSMTMDNKGRPYLVGWEQAPAAPTPQPLVVQVTI